MNVRMKVRIETVPQKRMRTRMVVRMKRMPWMEQLMGMRGRLGGKTVLMQVQMRMKGS